MHTDEVVGVHDSVDEAVEDNGEVDVTIVEDIDIEPVKEKDSKVVVDMQEGQLSPFLAQDNEGGVPKVPNFGDIKQPKQIGHGWAGSIVSVARNGDTVSIAVGQEESLDGHVGT